MIRSRPEILRQNKQLAETIIRHQILRKQFDQDTFIEKEGVDLKTFGRVISKAIKRNESLKDQPLRFVAGDDAYPFFSPANEPIIREDVYRSSHDADDEKEMDNLLLLKELQSFLGADHLLVISDYTTPWLEQWSDDDEALENSLSFLKKQIGVNFNGGFELSGDDILAYLGYLNALSPRLYMAFNNSSTILFICKYGNIHLMYFDEVEKEFISMFLESTGFSKVKQCGKTMDPDEFYKMLGKLIDDELGKAM